MTRHSSARVRCPVAILAVLHRSTALFARVAPGPIRAGLAQTTSAPVFPFAFAVGSANARIPDKTKANPSSPGPLRAVRKSSRSIARHVPDRQCVARQNQFLAWRYEIFYQWRKECMEGFVPTQLRFAKA